MVTEKAIIIDGENHMLGRLSSRIAKQLLLGKKIVVVRCEGICMSGKYKRMECNSFHLKVDKFKMYLRKRVNTNPRKGPFHFRSPAKMLIKSVRGIIEIVNSGMLPSRTERGKKVLLNLSTFVGVPQKYASQKKMVVPSAHRILCLQPSNPYNKLSLLAKNFGWKYADVTQRLEQKRKDKGVEYLKKKKEKMALIRKAKERLGQRLVGLETKLMQLGYAC
ncbi:hypothetical protein HZS_2088 [Henneguya salminicola]|nr:hypothetical protein HZS_2088 [Henneguya salminicola]